MDQLIPVEQKVVNFNGAEILGVRANDGKVYIGVKWICDGIGLDDRRQREKLQQHPTLSKGVSGLTLPSNGGPQNTLVLELDYLPIWLATINPSLVGNEESQKKLIEYQLKAKDVLAQAFLPQQNAQQMTTMEMVAYLAQKAVENERADAERDNEVKSLRSGLETLTDNLTVVPDAAKVKDLINQYQRWSRLEHDKVYGSIYEILLDQHGIDVPRKVSNERVKLDAEYYTKNGKHYAAKTLKQKVSGIDVMVRMGVLDKFHSILVGLMAKAKRDHTRIQRGE